MAYRQPGVKVTQEFVNALPALAAFALPNVNVGPAFQVVSKKDAGSYTGISTDYLYPDQIAGTTVDISNNTSDLINYPVKIDLKNTIVRIANTATSGAVLTGQLNNFTDATSNIFANIAAGDVIVVTGSGSGNNGSYTVRSKTDNNTLVTNETFAAAEASLTYTIRRNIGALNIPTSTAGVVVAVDKVTIPATLTTTYAPFGSVPIISAGVQLTYRALRLEQSSDVFEYKKTSELQAAFGLDQIVPENPVVFAAFVALNNSATPTNILELKADYLTDELLAYSNAFDILALTDMYAISVLSQNTSVHTSLKSHVETYSQPDKKKERVGIFNRKIVLTAVVKSSFVTSGGGNGLLGDNVSFVYAGGTFITDGVVPGHYLNITSPTPQAGRYKIASVDSQTKLTLVASSLTGGPITGVTAFIDKDLQKGEQASVLAAYAQGIGSRRMIMTWPDIVNMPVGNAVKPLPGYFLNASVCALTTGLPTQQGFTNLSVSVYTGVVHSTKYFDDDQLNSIADGGVMIFVQDVLDQTPLFIRHQLTTDRSAIKFQEYSVTKNVDFIAKFIRTNHQQFIGKYNIVDAAFDDLKTQANGIITFLRDSTKQPKIGGVIKSGKLTSISQDPVNIDTIIERYSLDIPIPLNNLDITIVV